MRRAVSLKERIDFAQVILGPDAVSHQNLDRCLTDAEILCPFSDKIRDQLDSLSRPRVAFWDSTNKDSWLGEICACVHHLIVPSSALRRATLWATGVPGWERRRAIGESALETRSWRFHRSERGGASQGHAVINIMMVRGESSALNQLTYLIVLGFGRRIKFRGAHFVV
jgi:hypothetical protein